MGSGYARRRKLLHEDPEIKRTGYLVVGGITLVCLLPIFILTLLHNEVSANNKEQKNITKSQRVQPTVNNKQIADSMSGNSNQLAVANTLTAAEIILSSPFDLPPAGGDVFYAHDTGGNVVMKKTKNYVVYTLSGVETVTLLDDNEQPIKTQERNTYRDGYKTHFL